MNSRITIRAFLLAGSACLAMPAFAQTAPAAETTAPTDPAADATENNDIIVIGTTSKNRSLITASADITQASEAEIQRKVPKSVAELLELVPGIFVEGTGGAVSNNYSVRGLQGGGQRFIQLEEDGLPVLYTGGGPDRFFAYDVTIERLEAVRGGSSGVLSVNGAAATIDFISRKPNFEKAEGIAKVQVQSYGEKRADFYYSAPLKDNLAFNIGGYISSSPGIRNNPFIHQTYHLKGALEYRFDGGGSIKVTAKIGDQTDAFYADYPIRLANGQIGSIAGFDAKRDNINGSAFAQIDLPVSRFVEADGMRTFSSANGIRAITKQIAVDFKKPVTEHLEVFAKARYLDYSWDFNGLFPGSGTGNGGLASAVSYLTPGRSPLNDRLTAGQAAFPAAVRFGIRDLTGGRVIASNDTAALNALNGNGLLQQTVLNHDQQAGKDFASNFGLRVENEFSIFRNSFTGGIQYYNVRASQNQSATSPVLNDVRNDSHIYDLVALDANNNVVGTLTDNGVISYGNWGAGINRSETSSVSFYGNDEVKIGDNFNLDFGLRHERYRITQFIGNTAAINQPVVPGTVGLARDVGATFDGTFSQQRRSNDETAYTVGANYRIFKNLAVYGRYARGFQTDPGGAVSVILYEAGLRYQGHGLRGSVTVFRTQFNNQGYGFFDAANPTLQGDFRADLKTDGIEVDLSYRPVPWFEIDAVGVFQDPSLTNARLGRAPVGGSAVVFTPVPQFNGNTPERTPKRLFTISPTFHLPHGLGEVYGRYKYIGAIFADPNNGLPLPGYGVTSAGFNINVARNLQFGGSVDNLFSVTGITEGNPRQGLSQTVTNSLFYGRGLVGVTYAGSVTFRF